MLVKDKITVGNVGGENNICNLIPRKLLDYKPYQHICALVLFEHKTSGQMEELWTTEIPDLTSFGFKHTTEYSFYSIDDRFNIKRQIVTTDINEIEKMKQIFPHNYITNVEVIIK